MILPVRGLTTTGALPGNDGAFGCDGAAPAGAVSDPTGAIAPGHVSVRTWMPAKYQYWPVSDEPC
jgi:hypothetical protein